ncbi:D-alanyl-D-alanine carboxypeptidase family protein [Microbacterium sp. CJ88]|uniref:D-alanyl-D-alanine carboxypeptidase family protein n=1 Tax=Microbacterium sp. CJ88 TaxID=3445672 RepID=UPI003F656EE5
MTLDDAPPRPHDDAPPTRRSRRSRARNGADAAPAAAAPIEAPALDAGTLGSDATIATPAPSPTPAPVIDPDAPIGPAAPSGPDRRRAVKKKDAAIPRAAFAWVEERAVSVPPRTTAATGGGYVPVEPDLLWDAPRRSPWRPGILVPIGVILALIAVYCATTLLWPLHALAPTVGALQVPSAVAPATTPAWPAQGSAAVSVTGIGAVASTVDAAQMASITKVVTALVVLDAMPLAVGETGPEYRFTSADSSAYWAYRRGNQSALDVPAGGTLTQLQLLQGMLIGSANNYADRLAGNLWASDRVYASAANGWLAAHGVTGVTVVDPSGIEAGNTATPAGLIALGERAMANPVIAQIVATKQIDLPGAGLVTNTNALLDDPGMVGIKTGSLDSYNLLSAKDVAIGGTTVRLYASVQGQVDDAARLGASRALYAQLEGELQPTTAVASGTVVGTVDTRWGETARVVADSDARVILWNGGAGTVSSSFDLGENRTANDVVGSLSVKGPLDAASVQLRLADDIAPPSPWWRLTHPLDLFGLNG